MTPLYLTQLGHSDIFLKAFEAKLYSPTPQNSGMIKEQRPITIAWSDILEIILVICKGNPCHLVLLQEDLAWQLLHL